MSLSQDVREKADGTVYVQGSDGTNDQAYTAGGAALVDGSAVTQPISAASLPLPTGAATAANQATEIASLASIDAGIPAALGQTTMSASMPVVIASDQSAIPVTSPAASTAALTQVAVTTSSQVALALNTARKGAIFFNGTNKTIYLAFAATASTTAFTYQMQQNSTVELANPTYTGVISVIGASGVSGNLVITQLT